LVGIAILLALVIGIYLCVRWQRWCETPQELRGDWWSDFERDFRPYARRRHNDKGSIG
jgi:hypothetical protein